MYGEPCLRREVEGGGSDGQPQTTVGFGGEAITVVDRGPRGGEGLANVRAVCWDTKPTALTRAEEGLAAREKAMAADRA